MMRSFFIATAILVSFSFAPAEETSRKETGEFSPNTSSAEGKCRLKIKQKLDNGVRIEGVVTIEGEDMNWFKCAGLKIANWFW